MSIRYEITGQFTMTVHVEDRDTAIELARAAFAAMNVHEIVSFEAIPMKTRRIETHTIIEGEQL